MIDDNAPKKGKTFLHYKGGHYRVICVARLSEDRDVEHVVYVSIEMGTIWARPLKNSPHRPEENCWSDLVDWPDGSHKPRFIRDDGPIP